MTAVRLDPFKRIVNVGWPVASPVLVIEVDYNSTFFLPGAFNISTPFGSFNLFSAIHEHIVDHDASVVNPITKDMLRFLYAWTSNPFYKNGPTADKAYKGSAWVFFSLATIGKLLSPTATELVLTISTPASPGDSIEPSTTYYVWDNLVSFEEALAHPSLHIAYVGNEAEANEVLANLHAGGSTSYIITTVTTESAIHRTFHWFINALIYRDRLDFPFAIVSGDDHATPAWTFSEFTSIGVHGDTPPRPLPARTLTIKINRKTLAITEIG